MGQGMIPWVDSTKEDNCEYREDAGFPGKTLNLAAPTTS